MEKNPLENREAVTLPNFLYESNGKILTGALGDYEITTDYHQFLAGSNLTPKSLPPFLYENKGEIYMGAPDDSDVTEMWEEWIEESK